MILKVIICNSCLGREDLNLEGDPPQYWAELALGDEPTLHVWPKCVRDKINPHGPGHEPTLDPPTKLEKLARDTQELDSPRIMIKGNG